MMPKLPLFPLERLFLAALLLLIGGVVAGRGIGLLREPRRMAAHEERSWMAWSYRRSNTAALFAEAAPLLRYGEVICLRVPRGAARDPWYRTMASYYLPDQTIAAVRERGEARFPAQATVVVIRASGEVEVHRGGGLGQSG